jgi:hypothetical protein
MEQGWQPFAEAVFPPDRPDVCGRRSCVRRRRASASTWRGELTDIWYDIHRERRPIKKSVEEKAHPCATPERLLDRIIRLATDPGDIVLDAFAGTGTSALVAERLNRRFIAIEQADEYLHVAGHRLREKRSSWQRTIKPSQSGTASKRALQLELKRLTLQLGRLPSPAEVEQLSNYSPAMFAKAFDSWRVALKAARTALALLPDSAETTASAEQIEMFAPPSRLPRVLELLEKQRPHFDQIQAEAIGEAGGSEAHGATVMTDEDEPPAYLIS